MKKTTNVKIIDILLYATLIFVSNFVASRFSGIVINILFKPLVGSMPYILLVICVYIVYILIGFAIPLGFVFFFFRSVVRKQYSPSEDKLDWVKSCGMLILPAEILRFIVCLGSLGHINQTGDFSFLPGLLFESTYLIWSGRHEPVRQLLQYNIADFFAYAICYFIYAIIHLLLVLYVYRYFLLVGKRDCEDLVVYETKIKYWWNY